MGFYRSDDNDVEQKTLYATIKELVKQKDYEFKDMPDRYKFEDYHIISINPNK